MKQSFPRGPEASNPHLRSRMCLVFTRTGRAVSGFVLESPTQRDDLVRSDWTVILNGGITAASSRLEQIEGPVHEALRAR